MERRDDSPVLEQLEFLDKGHQLGTEIEQYLGVELAYLVHPQLLTLIGASVYAPNELSLSSPNVHTLVSKDIRNYPESTIQKSGYSREQLEQKYIALVGFDPQSNQTNFSNGEIASVLRGAKEKVGEKGAQTLERMCANMMARFLKLDKSILNRLANPGIRIDLSNPDANNVTLFADESPFIQIPSPDVVVEYGPGIASFKKLPHEVKATPLTVFIEKSVYANQLLVYGARLYGIQVENVPNKPAQLIGREDGIKSATQELIRVGADDIDLIIASGAQSAAKEELTAGVINGHRLLRKGGVFVIRNIKGLVNEISGMEILDLLRQTFKTDPIAYNDFTAIQPTTGIRTPAFTAAFKK